MYENQNPIPQAPKPNDRRGLAIASLVLGIVSLVLFCVNWISIPCAILALIFGALSVKSSGRGMAIAGIVTSAIALVIVILATVVLGSIFAAIFEELGAGMY